MLSVAGEITASVKGNLHQVRTPPPLIVHNPPLCSCLLTFTLRTSSLVVLVLVQINPSVLFPFFNQPLNKYVPIRKDVNPSWSEYEMYALPLPKGGTSRRLLICSWSLMQFESIYHRDSHMYSAPTESSPLAPSLADCIIADAAFRFRSFSKYTSSTCCLASGVCDASVFTVSAWVANQHISAPLCIMQLCGPAS